MRSTAKPLLAAVLVAGALASAGVVAITATPSALAICGPGPCPGPSPTPTFTPRPPVVVFSTTGLTGRDETLTPSSPGPATIQIGAMESFTATATSSIAGVTVALAGADTFTCQQSDGVLVSHDTTYAPGFTSSQATFTRQPFTCDFGQRLTTGTYTLYAEAENSSGTVIGRTPVQAYQFTPQLTEDNVSVPESSYGVDTGLMVLPGDTVYITAGGQIWAGVLLTGTNGPDGWTGPDTVDTCASKFPLPCAPPYSLIGQLATTGEYFEIGTGSSQYPELSPGPIPDRVITTPSKLILRTNDDTPGNGSGAFTASIQIDRYNQF